MTGSPSEWADRTFAAVDLGVGRLPYHSLHSFGLSLPRFSTLAILDKRRGYKGTGMDDLLQRITISPTMAFGKPTIRGLRYSVEWLLELLSSGMSHEEILADYEDLEEEDIYAVLVYATKLAQVKRTVAVGV